MVYISFIREKFVGISLHIYEDYFGNSNELGGFLAKEI